MKGKDPKAQNNPLPTFNPNVGKGEDTGTNLVLLLLTPGMGKQEIKISFPSHASGYSCALLHVKQRASHKQLQTKRCWCSGLTHNLESHEKLLWFQHRAAGQNSPPCTNTRLGTTEIKTKSSFSCLKSCQEYQVLLLPS